MYTIYRTLSSLIFLFPLNHSEFELCRDFLFWHSGDTKWVWDFYWTVLVLKCPEVPSRLNQLHTNHWYWVGKTTLATLGTFLLKHPLWIYFPLSQTGSLHLHTYRMSAWCGQCRNILPECNADTKFSWTLKKAECWNIQILFNGSNHMEHVSCGCRCRCIPV